MFAVKEKCLGKLSPSKYINAALKYEWLSLL